MPGSHHALTVLTSIAAVILATCGCVPSAEPDPTQRVNGWVEGHEFKLIQGHGRAANAKGGLAVELADYALTCGLMLEAASEGSRFLSVVLAEATGPGTYELSASALGGTVIASVTTLTRMPEGHLEAKSLLLTEGTVRIDRADSESIDGFVQVKTGADTALAGTFAAPRCPAP